MNREKRAPVSVKRGEASLIAEEDLFATQDGRVVSAEDPEANSLIARAGQPIPEHLAEQFGIKESAGDKDDEPESRERKQPADKK